MNKVANALVQSIVAQDIPHHQAEKAVKILMSRTKYMEYWIDWYNAQHSNSL